VALCGPDSAGKDAEALLADATTALGVARTSGGDRVAFAPTAVEAR
jgi:hypothetical protein